MNENCGEDTYVQNVITVCKTSVIQEQVEDKVIKMLIELPNGEQRLVAFDIPDESCTVQDLLQQVGIPCEAETNISLVEDPTVLQIHYIVQVQRLKSVNENNAANNSLQFSNNSNSSSSQIEEPKFVEGKLAVCTQCGFLSSTFHRCQRCKRKLPENVKSVFDNYSTKGTEKLSTEVDPLESTNKIEIENVPINIKTEETENSSGNEETDGRESCEPFPVCLTESAHTFLTCRTVRIGSYKYFPQENIIISQHGLRLNVPFLEDNHKIVKLEIKYQDIIRVMINFGRILPVIFFITSTKTAAKIRKLLGMHSSQNPYYDPASRDITHKRITLLPETISEESKIVLRNLFELKLEELNNAEANEILVRSSPKEPSKRYRTRKCSMSGQGYERKNVKDNDKHRMDKSLEINEERI